MVLTTLRLMNSGAIKEMMEYSDVDFDMTMEIIKIISTHNDYIFNVMDQERPEGIAVANSYSTVTRALPGYFKTDDMKAGTKQVDRSLAPSSFVQLTLRLVFGAELSSRTARREFGRFPSRLKSSKTFGSLRN